MIRERLLCILSLVSILHNMVAPAGVYPGNNNCANN